MKKEYFLFEADYISFPENDLLFANEKYGYKWKSLLKPTVEYIFLSYTKSKILYITIIDSENFWIKSLKAFHFLSKEIDNILWGHKTLFTLTASSYFQNPNQKSYFIFLFKLCFIKWIQRNYYWVLELKKSNFKDAYHSFLKPYKRFQIWVSSLSITIFIYVLKNKFTSVYKPMLL